MVRSVHYPARKRTVAFEFLQSAASSFIETDLPGKLVFPPHVKWDGWVFI